MGASGSGGLGYGPGASVGAALAHKGTGRIPVALQPDGEMLYCATALWTAAHHRIPLLMVMFNNRTYYNSEIHAINLAAERERPVETRGVGIFINDPCVDFAKLAQSQGVYGEGPIESPEDIGPALRRALAEVKAGRPALVDIVTQVR